MHNLILNTDSYKASHYKQYPQGTETVFSYIEARENSEYNEVCFFGLQYFVKKYLSQRITQKDISEASNIIQGTGLPFNWVGWHLLLSKYEGLLPIKIKAVPEGQVIKKGNVLVTVVNTDPDFYWLTSYIETALLRSVWYPTTVATISREGKKTIKAYLRETCDSPDEEIKFKLNDFGSRGVSSYESSEIGGAAHLVNFLGTDNIPAIGIMKEYYNAVNMCGFSIPAMEHSTVTSWGKKYEFDSYLNMIETFGAKGKMLACVSDSYDIFRTVQEFWCSPEIIKKVREKDCTIIIRPDSGNPVEVLKKIFPLLEEKVGVWINNKGYKVLDNHFRVIQGDGVNLNSIAEILNMLKSLKYSAENIAFGMGAELLQKVNRDTLSFAMKASAIKKDNSWHNIGKNPITDKNKVQKQGILTLRQNPESGEWFTSNDRSWQDKELLQTYYKDGIIYCNDSLDEIRKRAEI